MIWGWSMNLEVVRRVLDGVEDLRGAEIELHEINRGRERAFSLYPRARAANARATVGGRGNLGYDLVRVTMMMRLGRDGEAAMAEAARIYEGIDGFGFVVDGVPGRNPKGFLMGANGGAAWLGMDGRGVFEWVLDFDCFIERMEGAYGLSG